MELIHFTPWFIDGSLDHKDNVKYREWLCTYLPKLMYVDKTRIESKYGYLVICGDIKNRKERKAILYFRFLSTLSLVSQDIFYEKIKKI